MSTEQNKAAAPAHVLAMAQALVKQLGEPFPREELDLDAVRCVALFVASTQQAEPNSIDKEHVNAQLATDPYDTEPGQQRELAGAMALGQPMGSGANESAGNSKPKGAVALTKQAEPAQAAVPSQRPMDDAKSERAIAYTAGWNACREAMLAAQPKAEPVREVETADHTRALNLAYQFRSHPASRSIAEIEQAGEIILALLAHPAPAQAPLTDEQIAKAQGDCFNWLAEHTGYTGGMGGETWDRESGRAVMHECAAAWGVKLDKEQAR